MDENEIIDFENNTGSTPNEIDFWAYMESYWHTNRNFPETIDTKIGKKADLVDGKVPNSQLPSYVDDVLEFNNFDSLPASGEKGKIYVTINNNFQFRWSGSEYIQINPDVNSMTINTAQNISGTKRFYTTGGNLYSNNCLWVKSEDGSFPGITFNRVGYNTSSLHSDGDVFHFNKIGTSTNYSNIKVNGIYKQGSDDTKLLLGGGGDKAISDFVLSKDLHIHPNLANLNSINQNLGTSHSPTFANLYTIGRIGIGTTSQTHLLDVNGNTRLSGNVGIGIGASNNYKLDVIGTSRFTGNIGINTAPSTTYDLNVNGSSFFSKGVWNSVSSGEGIISKSVNNVSHNSIILKISSPNPSEQMGSWEFNIFRYVSLYYNFRVTSYKYNNTWHYAFVQWLGGKPEDIDSIKLLKQDDSNLYVEVIFATNMSHSNTKVSYHGYTYGVNIELGLFNSSELDTSSYTTVHNIFSSSFIYPQPIATSTVVGGVKIGSNLAVDATGLLNGNYPIGNLSILNTGTSRTSSVWNAKDLNDWFTSKASSTYIPTTQKGVANGVATLDSNTEIPNSQIPTRLSDKVIAIGGEFADGSFTGLYDRNQLALADKEHTARAILTGAGTFNEASLLDTIFNSKSDFATIANVDTTTVLTITVTFSAILNNYSRGQWQPFIQQRLGNDRAFRRVKVEIQDWVTNNWITMHDVSNMPIIDKSGLWLPNESIPGTASIRAVRFTLSEPNSFNGIVYLSNIGLRHVSHSFTPQFLHRGENNILYGTTTVKKQIINQVATGIAPMQISSTTLVDNLNADLLDGKHASDFSLSTHNHNGVYEPVFSKNTAFNKNFGVVAGTVAQGNDSRINNGQIAYNWGYHGDYGYIPINEDFAVNSANKLAISDGKFNKEAGLVDTNNEHIIAGKEDNHYKYGAQLGYSGGMIINRVTGNMAYGGTMPLSSHKHYFNGDVRVANTISFEASTGNDLLVGDGTLLQMEKEVSQYNGDVRVNKLDRYLTGEYNTYDSDNKFIEITLEEGGSLETPEIYHQQSITINNLSSIDSAEFSVVALGITVSIPPNCSVLLFAHTPTLLIQKGILRDECRIIT